MGIIKSIQDASAEHEERLTSHLSKAEQEDYYRHKLEERRDRQKTIRKVLICFLVAYLVFSIIFLLTFKSEY